VAARTSSFQFKGKHEDIAKIADALNVSHILEGSVRRSGNKLRITAQLIKADDGFHLWSNSYDRDVDDIFAVQDEIAAAISDVLKVKLALVGGEAEQPTVIKVANTDAYDAYLRGRELIHRRGSPNVGDAVRHLERSLRLDEGFAPAHAQLAIATSLLFFYGAYNQEEAFRTVISHLDRALELDPSLPEAHGGRALFALDSNDPESTIEHAQKALALNPNYADAINWLHIALRDLGRYEEADAAIKRMLVIDPLTLVGRYNYAMQLAAKGRIEEAHEMADQLLAQGPWIGYASHARLSFFYEGKIAESLSWALENLAETGRPPTSLRIGFSLVSENDEARRLDESMAHWIDLAEGRFDEAIQVTQRRMQMEPENERAVWMAAEFLYTAGRIDEALPLYERLLDFVPEGRPIFSVNKFYRSDNETMMRLALARRKAGDEDGAQAAARIAKKDHAARGAAGYKSQFHHRTEAMIAAFENNPDRVIAALKSAIQLGLRDPQVFDDLIFEDLWDEPRFVALQMELDVILAAEHDKVLQLICFNNPVRADWQPLPETCEGVEEQLIL
jgi:tetratricopeptide (TPR) repeat protein